MSFKGWVSPTIGKHGNLSIIIIMRMIMAGTHHIHVRVEADGREVWVESNPGENQGWLAFYALRHLGV